jgi:hypothetical protein
MEFFEIVFGAVPTWLRILVAASVLLAIVIPRLRTLWADLVHGEGWWTATKLRLEIEKLQFEIAILKSDAATKCIERVVPLQPVQEGRKPLTIDRLFWRQSLGAWLGGMMPLIFFQVIAMAATLSKQGSLDSMK